VDAQTAWGRLSTVTTLLKRDCHYTPQAATTLLKRGRDCHYTPQTVSAGRCSDCHCTPQGRTEQGTLILSFQQVPCSTGSSSDKRTVLISDTTGSPVASRHALPRPCCCCRCCCYLLPGMHCIVLDGYAEDPAEVTVPSNHGLLPTTTTKFTSTTAVTTTATTTTNKKNKSEARAGRSKKVLGSCNVIVQSQQHSHTSCTVHRGSQRQLDCRSKVTSENSRCKIVRGAPYW
ncbi:unnamed protein product, partial [Polarella glacialis]